MGLFEKLRNDQQNVPASPQPAGNRTETVVFAKLPDTLEEFKALAQAQMANPFDTAARIPQDPCSSVLPRTESGTSGSNFCLRISGSRKAPIRGRKQQRSIIKGGLIQ